MNMMEIYHWLSSTTLPYHFQPLRNCAQSQEYFPGGTTAVNNHPRIEKHKNFLPIETQSNHISHFNYPNEFYDFIRDQVPTCGHAWDCATGRGQVAINLAVFFERVTATDISAHEIHNTPYISNVNFQVLAAEDACFAANLFDTVCVVQAIHLIDTQALYRQVDHCLKSQGLLLIAGYTFNKPLSTALEQVVEHFRCVVLQKYWPANHLLLLDGLQHLPFPYERIHTPKLLIRQRWNLQDYLRHIRTWSATQRYIERCRLDPMPRLARELAAVWPAGREYLEFEWELSLLAGKKP
ncbi:class I SAM-dependent methyltransferase [Pseudomonas protegens]|uniref:class I SAM-dependent methyltransferase n=1 Tax=Pseudomonas protegens TaxID=380021 RepID=UPI002743C232|nr:class I SAM-dependent methyltransferase [Pseudomonas protegens]MDP9501971.1 class I SAM-dependent methyltransferase [Pseudomonas protegens]